MEKEFVTYEQALALKELGFDEPCLAFYDGTWDTKIYFNYKRDSSGDYEPFTTSERLNWFGAPLKQQVFRWFRDKYGICSWIERLYTKNSVAYYKTTQEYKKDASSKMHNLNISLKEYNTYEEAENACIDKLIEIVKNKTDEKNNNTDNNSNSRLHL